MSSATKSEQPESAGANPGAPAPRRSRRRQITGIGIIAIVGIFAYVVSLLAYAASGRSEVDTDFATLGLEQDGVNVGADLVAIDPIKGQMTLRIGLQPTGRFYNVDEATYAVPLRISVLQTTGITVKDIPMGQTVGSANEYTVPVEGNSQTYPFDEYRLNFVVPGENADGVPAGIPHQVVDDDLVTPWPLVQIFELGGDGKPLDADVTIGYGGPPRGIQGWSEAWQFYGSNSIFWADATVKRSGGVLAFVMVVLVLMITIAVLAAIVATRVWRKQRPIEATMMSWFAALLFALIPLRNFMPGSPAIGAWLDVTVFFWVEAALLLSMSVFVASWLRYRKPPED